MAKDFQNIKNLPIRFGIKMLSHTLDKEAESKAWDMWIAQYPNMSKDTFVPFSKFFDDLRPKQVSHKTSQELIAEANQIRQSLGR